MPFVPTDKTIIFNNNSPHNTTAMSCNIFLFIVLVLTCGSLVSSQCTPTNNAAVTKLSSALDTPSLVVTFDDIGLDPLIGWSDKNGGPLDLSKANLSIALYQQPSQTTYCGVSNFPYSLNGKTVTWSSRGFWSGSTTEQPLFSLFGYPSGICGLQFSPPIYAFVARANVLDYASGLALPWLQIYDQAAKPLECQTISITSGTNTYQYYGFISTVPIAYLNFFVTGNGYVMDNLQLLSCGQGFNWNGTDCVDTDECLDDPCEGDHVTCLNTEGSYSCLCDEGYETKNGTCQAIDRCSPSPCSSFATCANTNNSSFNCTCNEGYEGDGVGADGCQAIQTPIAGDTPSGPSASNVPSTVQPSTTSPPVAGRTPRSSSIVSAANLLSVMNAVLLVLLVAFV